MSRKCDQCWQPIEEERLRAPGGQLLKYCAKCVERMAKLRGRRRKQAKVTRVRRIL